MCIWVRALHFCLSIGCSLKKCVSARSLSLYCSSGSARSRSSRSSVGWDVSRVGMLAAAAGAAAVERFGTAAVDVLRFFVLPLIAGGALRRDGGLFAGKIAQATSADANRARRVASIAGSAATSSGSSSSLCCILAHTKRV